MTAPDTPEPSTPAAVERYVHKARLTNVDLAQQEQLCLDLRLQHHTIREISAITGLSVGTVHKRITDAIDRNISPFVEKYRVLERERLDGLSRRVLQLMAKPRYLMHDGQVVTIDEEPVEDIALTLACVDKLLKIQERRARLEGLDAPVKVDVGQVEAPLPDEALSMIEKARKVAEDAEQKLRKQAEGA
ncbi:hypothetical protein BBK82_03225 [Lentzea guizhouensis]|uniref:RNA polymerase sigma factor 70 region 4 type 2 domain-containing protein n=1 Tax=Lentzea guizhouensis TaxID=1586287 RepID=A0A1B2HBZ8_9PSEU|nr:hypothetical protein [Lentzea guizhouensis]ANZ35229.1 hypothetical protein BBK82_03225 [Lentzea guizhouensis]